MKKTIVFMITALLVLMPILPISAEDAKTTISVTEAEELIQMSFDFYNDIRRPLDYIGESNEAPYMDVDNGIGVEYVCNKGTEYEKIEKRYYCLVIEECLPGGSFEGMREYVRTIYMDGIADESYRYDARNGFGATDFYDDFYELFYKNNDGKMYIRWRPYVTGTLTNYILVNEGFELELTEGDSEYAKANVKVWINTSGDVTPPVQRTIECSFKNTENGWRISESDFSEMMATDGFKWLGVVPIPPDPYGPPPTGDENVSRVWWLAGVSLAALVPAALLVQRRRRRED